MAKNTYLSGQPILCQLLSFVPKHLVDESVLEQRSDRYYKTMTTYKQLVFLFYGVVTRCKSLNNLCKNLLLLEDKLTYLGINELPAVSTLSDANGGIISDQRILLKDGLEARLVVFKDYVSRKILRFVSNLFDYDVMTIVQLYKYRWNIEVLFKQLKQNFELCYFFFPGNPLDRTARKASKHKSGSL